MTGVLDSIITNRNWGKKYGPTPSERLQSQGNQGVDFSENL